MGDRTKTSRRLIALIVLLSLSVFINYIDRGNLSIAAPLLKTELHLSATQLGLLFTSFFITYSIGNFVAGWFVDRFEAFRVLLGGFIVWSLATILSGFAAGFAMLFALRLVLGAGEAVAYPSYSQILARCYNEQQRGMANAAIFAGMALGPAFGIFFGGMLIGAYGWRSFFVAFGIASLWWIVPWLALAPKCLEKPQRTSVSGVDMRAIVRERSLWGASIGHFGGAYLWYFILTWIPFYLVHERHWSFTNMAIIGGATYLLAAISLLSSGWLADRWIRAGASPTLARKTFLCISCTGSATAMIGCVLADAMTSAMFLMIAGFAWGIGSSNSFAVAQTLAGCNAAGRWVGIQNGLGNLAGIIAPALTGVLVDRTGNFVLPFLLTGIVAILGAFAWVFFVGPVVEIDWSRRRESIPTVVGVTS